VNSVLLPVFGLPTSATRIVLDGAAVDMQFMNHEEHKGHEEVEKTIAKWDCGRH
jgi:hypothetical protein